MKHFTSPSSFVRKFFIILCLIFTIPIVVSAAGDDVLSPKIAILVSRNIKPYLEAVQGLSVMTDDAWRKEHFYSDIYPIIEVISLENFKGKSREILQKRLAQEDFLAYIAVGPEALRFIYSEITFENQKNLTPAIIFTMVLNPEEIVENSDKLSGIPLRIPIQAQTQEIARAFPCLKRPGLLYDPLYNTSFFNEAYEHGVSSDLKIIPLEVGSKKDIPLVLQENWNQIDSLWIIPDRTVISESIIQYIIKEAVLNNVPVIGYNHFFYDSGAAMAFVFDYAQIGKQTAKLALKVLAKADCQKESPKFQTLINSRVIKKLDIQYDSECKEQPVE